MNQTRAEAEKKNLINMPVNFKVFDFYGAPLPSFNIKGEDSIKSNCGGCVSLVIMYVTFIFAILKLQHLLDRHNPIINSFI